jgi:hypothetical protein
MKSTFLASLGNIIRTRWCTNASLISLDPDEESPLLKIKINLFCFAYVHAKLFCRFFNFYKNQCNLVAGTTLVSKATTKFKPLNPKPLGSCFGSTKGLKCLKRLMTSPFEIEGVDWV